MNADGSGQPQQLLSGTENLYVTSVSPDSTQIFFSQGATGLEQIKLLSITNKKVPIRNLISQATDQFDGKISPDGRWIAYVSDKPATMRFLFVHFPM